VVGVSIEFYLLHLHLFEHFQVRFIVLPLPPNHFTINHVYPCLHSHTLTISICVPVPSFSYTHYINPTYVAQDTQTRKYMVQIPSSEADRLSDSQKISYSLFNRNVRYRVYNSQPLFLSWVRSIQSTVSNPISVGSISMLSIYKSRCSRWFFHSVFPIKSLYAFLLTPRLPHVPSTLSSLIWP
jgi:hypothetical protein